MVVGGVLQSHLPYLHTIYRVCTCAWKCVNAHERVYMFTFVRVFVCVCVCARVREREHARAREREIPR